VTVGALRPSVEDVCERALRAEFAPRIEHEVATEELATGSSTRARASAVVRASVAVVALCGAQRSHANLASVTSH